MSADENLHWSTEDCTIAERKADQDEDNDVEAAISDDMRRSLNDLASRLCTTCRDFLRGEIPGLAYRVYHPSVSSLEKSVEAGCSICKDLSESLGDFCKQLRPPSAPIETWSIECEMFVFNSWHMPEGYKGSNNAFRLSFRLRGSDGASVIWDCRGISDFANMCFYPVDGLSLGPEFLDSSLEKSTAKSARSMDLARHWYHQCSSHSTCRNWRKESRTIPTRLVRLNRPDKSSSDIISAELCETSNLTHIIVYTTLSHIWGDEQIFQLQQRNIEELKQSIPVHKLPQVFKDAMYVSIELGIHYIWIDSLCIIQDSTKDWTYEAKRMGDVYQYAACNIAAAGVKSSNMALFGERKALSQIHPSVFADCIVTPKHEPGNPKHIHGLYIRADDQSFCSNIADGVLNSRAWVAQERALSPGILHITPEMIWWECNDLVANEAFPTGHIVWDDLELRTCKIRSLTEEGDSQNIYAFWRKFVGLYAGKELTYEQDRFPAAAGIARSLNELIDDNFVAGFWEKDLVRSLIMLREDGRIEGIPSTPRAPSWSWASLCARYPTISVWGPHGLGKPLGGISIRVLSDLPTFKSDLDSTSPESSDVQGLEITAPLRRWPTVINIRIGDNEQRWLYGIDIRYDVSRDGHSSLVNIPDTERWRVNNPTHFLVLAKKKQHLTSPSGPEPGNDSESEHGSFMNAWGLLVQQTFEAEGNNTFRKLGVVHFLFRTEDKMEEYLGLKKDDGEYVLSPALGECGFQTIVLI